MRSRVLLLQSQTGLYDVVPNADKSNDIHLVLNRYALQDPIRTRQGDVSSL